VSFASEPGRDDGGLPKVNIVVPDDARELERDVIAYRRELRAQRRRERIARLALPLRRAGLGGHAIIPLIAACLAISLVVGALLSVVTMTPASTPTLSASPRSSAQPTPSAVGRIPLPEGTVEFPENHQVPVRSLRHSAIALVPANCGCDQDLQRLADQSVTANVRLYFAGTGAAIPQLSGLAAQYGDYAAIPVADHADVLGTAYNPAGLVVLLVAGDATAEVYRSLPAGFDFGPEFRRLGVPAVQLDVPPVTGAS
jgi:hypothetical protein